MAADTAAAPTNPFIKQLAANDRPTRDRAVSSLRSYLSRSTPFSSTDLLKLWKGLFYSMWSSDRARTQQRLARDLAALVGELSTAANFVGFVRAFWVTMAREWAGIASLRMDKFLYLVRCYVGAGFAWLARGGGGGGGAWADAAARKDYLDVLAEVPFNPRDPKVPNGLRYHVIDIYADELDKVDKDRTAPIEELLAPLRRLGKESVTKVVKKRVEEALDDDRLRDWTGEHAQEEDDEALPLDDDAEAGEEEDGGDFEGFD
ncbi:hypothetical protein MBLNU459_g6441t1 [Dothideomycetes sp. NU459]